MKDFKFGNDFIPILVLIISNSMYICICNANELIELTFSGVAACVNQRY